MKNLFEIKSKHILIALIILLADASKAQTGLSLAAQMLNSASKNNKSRKAEKLATEYTTFITTIDGDVPMMRVPEEAIKSPAKSSIVEAQEELEKAHQNYLTGAITKMPLTFAYIIERVEEYDKDWVVSNYRAEADFYRQNDRKIAEAKRKHEQQKELERVEEKRRENIRLAEMARIKSEKKDSIDRAERNQRIADAKRLDSLAYIERTKGYHFVNTEKLNLREKPNVSSKVIAQVGDCSYVTIIPGYESNGWTKVAVGDYQGYVNEDYLVASLDDITVTGADIAFAKKSYFISVETAATYAAPYRPKVETRAYHTGPRGGCYYINANGRKEYVDHSFCD